jgi:hypothetical protein
MLAKQVSRSLDLSLSSWPAAGCRPQRRHQEPVGEMEVQPAIQHDGLRIQHMHRQGKSWPAPIPLRMSAWSGAAPQASSCGSRCARLAWIFRIAPDFAPRELSHPRQKVVCAGRILVTAPGCAAQSLSAAQRRRAGAAAAGANGSVPSRTGWVGFVRTQSGDSGALGAAILPAGSCGVHALRDPGAWLCARAL